MKQKVVSWLFWKVYLKWRYYATETELEGLKSGVEYDLHGFQWQKLMKFVKENDL